MDATLLKKIKLTPKTNTQTNNLKKEDITEETISKIKNLQEIAFARNQSLAEMALCWNLRNDKVTTVLIGSSRKEQILDNVKIVNHLDFTQEELDAIDKILS